MGLCPSTPDQGERPHSHANGSLPASSSADNVVVDSANKYDEIAINRLRNEFAENPEVFLLDNILMSVMFFENYEKEIHKLATTTTRLEKELNHKLIQEEYKQCIMPDVVFENVSKHVRFRPVHGRKKQISEPLAAQRLYVVHDNIEVVESVYDTSHYSGIDKPNYKIQVEFSKKHNGFVKLNQLEQIGLQTKRSNSEETLYNASSSSSEADKNISQINDDIAHFNGILDGPSTSTGIQSDSSDTYDYSTITKARTPQSLKVTAPSRKSNSLPSSCFTSLMVPNLNELRDLPDSDEEEDDTETELYKSITYINSSGFMRHFKNTVFPNSLGRLLGLDGDTIRGAKSIPGTIFCDSYDNKGNVTLKEIIPAVSINWPGEIAFEWPLREDRPTIIDRRTTLRYKWPTDAMINDIKRLQCVAIPRGCLQKRAENPDVKMEWEIAFPKAEKFIETRMSQAQMKSYLFILALHKTFIEPVTRRQGLLPEHIRILMYWECEANYPNWPENRLGKKLTAVLKHLYDTIARRHLPNYFIRSKNHFEDIPGKYLRPAQKLIYRIMESPVAYFLIALRNLRYMSGKFYPALDIKRLHSILTSEGMKMANPLLFKLVESERQPVKRKKYEDPKIEWNRKKLERIRRRKKQKEAEEKDVNLSESRRASVDSIDLQWSLEQTMDVYKKRSLLIFFIEHFIQIAKRSIVLATTRQSLFYLKQAWYLSKLLEEIYGCYPDAVEYQDKIRVEEEAVKRVAANEETAPHIPRRNSNVHNGELVQQVKGNNIHLNSLAKSYNLNTKAEAAKRKLKRSVSNTATIEDDSIEIVRRPNSERFEGRKTISFSKDVQSRRV